MPSVVRGQISRLKKTSSNYSHIALLALFPPCPVAIISRRKQNIQKLFVNDIPNPEMIMIARETM